MQWPNFSSLLQPVWFIGNKVSTHRLLNPCPNKAFPPWRKSSLPGLRGASTTPGFHGWLASTQLMRYIRKARRRWLALYNSDVDLVWVWKGNGVRRAILVAVLILVSPVKRAWVVLKPSLAVWHRVITPYRWVLSPCWSIAWRGITSCHQGSHVAFTRA